MAADGFKFVCNHYPNNIEFLPAGRARTQRRGIFRADYEGKTA